MIKPAVREVKAFWSPLKNEAVPALETHVAIRPGLVPARTFQTPSTETFAIGHGDHAFREISAAREAACLMIKVTSSAVSWANAERARDEAIRQSGELPPPHCCLLTRPATGAKRELC